MRPKKHCICVTCMQIGPFTSSSRQKQTSHTMDEKESKFQKIFSSHIINIEHLRRVSYGGIPTKYRATTWRVLLGTQGLNVKNMQKSVEAKNTKYLRSMLKVDTNRVISCIETCKRVHAGTDSCRCVMQELDTVERSTVFQTREALLDKGKGGIRICKKHRRQIDIDIRRLSCTHRTFFQADISFFFRTF